MNAAALRVISLLAVAGAVAAGCSASSSGGSGAATTAAAPSDAPPTVSYQVASRNHVDGPVDYPQSPPVGGDHNPVWQDCKAYTTPIRNENAVHSLEHGAVWITYQPDLAAATVAELAAFVDNQTHVLVSPYPGLSNPIVLTAWGVQQKLDTFDAAVIGAFIRTYEEGPQTPEPGAVCSGGLSEPA